MKTTSDTLLLHPTPDLDASKYALVQLLADQYILSLQALRCYWLIQDSDPNALHGYLEWQFDRLSQFVQQMIKQVHPAGYDHYPEVNQFLEFARLTDEGEDAENVQVMIQALRHGHEHLIGILANDLQQVAEGAIDFQTGEILQHMRAQHIFMAWMIRVYLS